jgi:hypothetical protein
MATSFISDRLYRVFIFAVVPKRRFAGQDGGEADEASAPQRILESLFYNGVLAMRKWFGIEPRIVCRNDTFVADSWTRPFEPPPDRAAREKRNRKAGKNGPSLAMN